MEFERLIGYFDGDASGFKRAGEEALRIADAVEKKFKNLKTDFKVGGSSSVQLKDAREMVKLQTDIARQETAAEQTRRAGIASRTAQIKLDREQVALDRERLRLQKLIVGTTAAGGNASPPKSAGARADAETQRAADFIRRLNASNRRAESDYTNFVTREAEKQFQARTKKQRQAADEFLKTLKRQEKAEQQANSAKSSGGEFKSDLFGTILGAATLSGLAVNAVSSILGGIKSGISAGLDQAIAAGVTAADYQRTRIAIAGVIGSAASADIAVARLEKTALNTPGLTFKNALDGYQRLRAVQFGAQDAERALVGLSKVKVLSGGTEDDLKAVLINFAQIRSVGKLTGDELRETLGRFPYFAQVLQKAFGTISTEKIGELQLSSEEFFERIFTEMDKLPPVAGGAGEAWAKLVDEFYKSQIAFGTPLLDPFTDSVQGLTKYLNENKNSFSSWGQTVGDVLRAVNEAAAKLEENAPEGSNGIFGDVVTRAVKSLSPAAGSLLDLSTVGGNLLAGRGAELRRRRDLEKSLKPTDDLSISSNDLFDKIGDPQKDKEDQEVRLYKEKVKEIGSLEKTRLAETDNFYTRQRALISGSLRQTTAEELSYAERINQIEKAEAANRIAVLSGSIARARALNEKLIASYLPQDQSKIRAVKERELAEQTATLEKEKAKYQLDEANRLRQISEIENRVFEERRKAQIEFKNLVVQQINDGAEKQSFAVQKGLDDQIISTETGYAELIEIARESQIRVSEINRDQLNLQLRDASLSHEQRLNIITKAYLDERKTAQESSRAIKEIEKRRTAAVLEEIQQRTESQLRLISSVQNGTSGLSVFGDVGEVSSVGNFGKLLGKAKELKKFFDTSNQSQAQYFRDQAKHYGMLVGQTEDLLTRLKRTRETMLPDEVPAAQTPPTNDGGSAFMSSEPPPSPSVAVPQINRRTVKADSDISNAEADLIQYKGIRDKFAQIAQQFNSFAQDIEKNYGTIQAEVFGLYESLGEGLSDYTVFDQIIEKNYLAQRALEGSALAAKVQGLSLQLSSAQKGLENGDISPAAVGDIKTKLLEAEQAQKAFNFETDLGKEKLDLLGKAAARFKALISGDKVETAAVLFQANLELYGEKNALAAENIALEKKYYQDSELWAEKRKNALLSFEREIYEARKNREIEESVPIKNRIALQQAQMPSYSEMFKNDIANLPNAMADMLDGVRQQWDGTWGGLFRGVVTGFVQMLADMAAEFARAAVSKLIGKLVGSLLGGFGGGGDNTGFTTFGGAGGNHGIGEFANGGDPPVGRLSLVGERGPELFIPKQAGTIITNEKTRELLSGGAGGRQTVNNVTVNQTFKSPRSMVAPKSTSQQARAAIEGASRAFRDE